MTRKRNRLEIIRDILLAINKKSGLIKPTHILYRSNLSHSMMDEYLKDLISKEMIEENKRKKGKTYSITKKGIDYLDRYKMIVDFTDSFGLD